MIGAIIGDIVGSIYEFHNIKSKNFQLFDDKCHFTDDTVMTIAVYKALKECKGNYENLSNKVIEKMKYYGKKYIECGFGSMFKTWLNSDNSLPYNSYGNGAGMRVSPVIDFASSIDEVKDLSKKVTMVTHNHIEGIKGAEATAVANYLAKNKFSKCEIKNYITKNYYQLDYDYQTLIKNYKFDVTCQGTIPVAIYCFLISSSFEDCLRTTISIGGDSDTLSAISCSIAEQFYGIPFKIKEKALEFLDKDLLEDIKEIL